MGRVGGHEYETHNERTKLTSWLHHKLHARRALLLHTSISAAPQQDWRRAACLPVLNPRRIQGSSTVQPF